MTMTDLEIARVNLKGHSICLCKDGEFFTDDGRGISPMIRILEEERVLRGYSVADMVVGKAAAMLFVKAGIIEVYAEVMSSAARDYLRQHNITCEWNTLTQRIINRAGTDICPMEKTVADISDAQEGYKALRAEVQRRQSYNERHN